MFDPPLIRLLGHVATRSKRHSKERTNHDETVSIIFGQLKGQVTRGHQRSNSAAFNIFVSTNQHITREPEELQHPRKAYSIAFLTFFRLHILRFDLRSTVWPLESKNSRNNHFYEECFL